MNVLTKDWQDGFLDAHRLDDEVRVRVGAWLVAGPVRDQFYERPRDWRILVNYVREIGLPATVGKVVSRLRESGRNAKYTAFGVGVVEEAGAGGAFQSGDAVLFVAYNHPRAQDRIVLPPAMLAAWDGAVPGDALRVYTDPAGLPPTDAVAGWAPYAERPLDADAVQSMLAAAAPVVANALAAAPDETAALASTPAREVSKREPETAPGVLRGVLFGLGNYAKTVVLPYLSKQIRVVRIHEVDPMQLGPAKEGGPALDTSPTPRGGDYDVWLIAGFHHTHAALAVQALDAGAAAITEKPLVTTRAQLDALKESVQRSPRLFACFHKRYTRFNDWARNDLAVAPGEPVTYHCIVYETPLPARHWYRWPSSGTRILSNGCHWIDHFLYLNDYAQVVHLDGREAANGDVTVTLELANGASFSMVLTDVGSYRLGVRDVITLRAGTRTVRTVDGTEYFAEDERRVLRRKRIGRQDSYQSMYRRIGDAVAAGEPGDDLRSLYSSRVVLDVEEHIQARRSTSIHASSPLERQDG